MTTHDWAQPNSETGIYTPQHHVTLQGSFSTLRQKVNPQVRVTEEREKPELPRDGETPGERSSGSSDGGCR